MALQLGSTSTAKFGSGRIFFPAAFALCLSRGAHRRSAMIAKAHTLRVLFSALGTNRQRKRRTAVVAELAGTRGLSARGTSDRLTLNLSLPDGRAFGCFVNVAAHSLRPGFCHRDLLTGRAVGAKRFILVVAGIAYPLMAAMAAVEMTLRFVFGPFKGFFMFFLPFGAHAIKPLGKNIPAPFQRIAKVPQGPAEQASQNARSACQPPQTPTLLICFGFHKAALISILA